MKKVFSLSKINTIPAWVVLPVLLLLFNFIVGFNGLYGQDSFEYLRYSRVLHDYLTGGSFPGIFFWPVLYPLSGALLSFILPGILALQVISIGCFGLAIYFIRRILLSLSPGRTKEINGYVLLFFSLSPFIMRSSSVVMSDSMTIFFLSAFFYYYLRYKDCRTTGYFLLMVLFASAAINTRYAALVIVAVPAADALSGFFRKFTLIPFLFALMIAFLIFLPAILLKQWGTQSLSGNILIPQWSVANFFHRTFNTADGHLAFALPNILFVFSNLIHPGYIFTGILFLFLIKRQTLNRPFLLMIVIVILVYALFIAGLTTQNPRFLLLTFPCGIILFSGSYFRICDILEKRSKKLRMLLVFLIIIVQLGLFSRSFLPVYRDNHIIREIAAKMKSYPGRTIYTFNIDMGLKAYDVKNEIINLWPFRIDNFKPGSILLFNYVNSYRQWKGMNPVNNLERVKKEHLLLRVETLPGNWNLYEIKN